MAGLVESIVEQARHITEQRKALQLSSQQREAIRLAEIEANKRRQQSEFAKALPYLEEKLKAEHILRFNPLHLAMESYFKSVMKDLRDYCFPNGKLFTYDEYDRLYARRRDNQYHHALALGWKEDDPEAGANIGFDRLILIQMIGMDGQTRPELASSKLHPLISVAARGLGDIDLALNQAVDMGIRFEQVLKDFQDITSRNSSDGLIIHGDDIRGIYSSNGVPADWEYRPTYRSSLGEYKSEPDKLKDTLALVLSDVGI